MSKHVSIDIYEYQLKMIIRQYDELRAYVFVADNVKKFVRKKYLSVIIMIY